MIACDRPIEFVPHSMGKYGMDAYRDPPVTGYQTLTMGTQVTGIGWKAISTDETGMLRVEVNDNDTDELDFQYQSGGTGVSVDGDAASGYTLSLQAPPENEDILLAVCNRDTTTGEASIAGGIGVAAYERLALELKIVPVGHELNYTEDQLEDALNDIYGQAVVSWDVEYLPPLDINYWDENGDGLIERPNTDYSNEMRAVWESFLASMQYDPVQQGQAYLFVIPGITEGGDVRGYMPIKSRYGFVTADATTRDVAHCLSRESGSWGTEFLIYATPFPKKIPLLCLRAIQKTLWTIPREQSYGNTSGILYMNPKEGGIFSKMWKRGKYVWKVSISMSSC